MRLIDADAIYDKIEQRYRILSGLEHRCERDFLDFICYAPTVDAVEVVRCRDCSEKELEDSGLKYGICCNNYYLKWEDSTFEIKEVEVEE